MNDKRLKAMRTCGKVFDKTFETVDCLLYVVMIGVVLLQIFARVFLPKVPAWTEELSRYLQVYLVAFATGSAIKYNSFVSVDTIFNFTGPKTTKVIKTINSIVTVVLFCFIFVSSIDMYKIGIPRQTVTMAPMTMNCIYFSMILLSASVVIAVIRREIHNYINKEGGKA